MVKHSRFAGSHAALVLSALLLAGCGGGGTRTGAPKPSATGPTPEVQAAFSPSAEVVYSVVDHWAEVEKLYRFGDGAAEPCPEEGKPPMPKAYPDGLSESVRSPVIYAHPAYTSKGEAGQTILQFKVSLPDRPTQLAFGAFLSRSSGPSDGVEFQVNVAGERVFGELVTQYVPQRRVVDLSSQAGQTVTIELITDAGKTAAADWAMWLDPRIVATP